MDAESLDKRVSYQEPTDGPPDALLQVAEVWATVVTVWAEVRTPTGRELQSAGQTVATADVVVTVRRARGWMPKPKGRFVLSTPVYDATPRVLSVVASFDPDSGREWVTCLCLEQTEPNEGT